MGRDNQNDRNKIKRRKVSSSDKIIHLKPRVILAIEVLIIEENLLIIIRIWKV